MQITFDGLKTAAFGPELFKSCALENEASPKRDTIKKMPNRNHRNEERIGCPDKSTTTSWISATTKRHAERKSFARMGRRRMRLPVAAKIAFATAGAVGGTPGSPQPLGASSLGTI